MVEAVAAVEVGLPAVELRVAEHWVVAARDSESKERCLTKTKWRRFDAG